MKRPASARGELWRAVRLKFFSSRLYGLSQPPEYQPEGVPFVRATNVARGNLVEKGLVFVSEEVLNDARTVRLTAGDIIVVRSGAYTGDSALVTSNWAGGVAGFDIVMRVTRFADPRFVAFSLLSPTVLSRQIEPMSGRAAQPHLNAEELGDVKLLLPPLNAQLAIADYLDYETARLDALVAAKERVLGLLAEKRRALVTRAVTRGLDPHAPLRDSGIPWLGEIPAHWELKRAKWLFWERDQRSTTGEEVLLSLRMERGLVPHNDVSVKQTEPEELVGYKHVSTGEIVVNRMRAASGLVAIAPQNGLVSPDYAVFRVSRSTNAEYFTHLFKTELMQAVFRSESTGLGTGSSGFLRLYSESFLSLWLPYPPPHEQAAILGHVGKALEGLGAIRAATERTITLLKERRAALIAAAVTGQIDIREGIV